MSFAFEKLVVYQKAMDFVDIITAKTEQSARGYGFLPKCLVSYGYCPSRWMSKNCRSSARSPEPFTQHLLGKSQYLVPELVMVENIDIPFSGPLLLPVLISTCCFENSHNTTLVCVFWRNPSIT